MNISAAARHVVRRCLARVPLRFYERAMFFPLYETSFAALDDTPISEDRERLWSDLFERIGPDSRVLYLEFGVWQGYSIERNASSNRNPDSLFIGFDTFEGLPEDWLRDKRQGHFSMSGKMPAPDDARIRFVKGLFQDTLDEALAGLRAEDFDAVVVHFDADLYSSTLYCLTRLRSFAEDIYFIFDEFLQDEARALYNFTQAFPSRVSFYGRTAGGIGYCNQVTGRLERSAGSEAGPSAAAAGDDDHASRTIDS